MVDMEEEEKNGIGPTCTKQVEVKVQELEKSVSEDEQEEVD